MRIIKSFLKLISILPIVSFGQSNLSVKDTIENTTKIEKPFELRDPFKAPPLRGEKSQKDSRPYVITAPGQYTNIQNIEISNIENIKLVGVLIGKERRAMVRLEDKGPIIPLKEGMKIGQDRAELKAILPGGIILVEKITNVYGQEEYLETVIPISK